MGSHRELSDIYYTQFSESNINDGLSEQDTISQKINQMLEYMLDIFAAEKNEIKNQKNNLYKFQQSFKQQIKIKMLKLERKKEIYQNNVNKAIKIKKSQNDIVFLNIGGTAKVTTTLQTLTKFPNSALAKMFSSKYKLPLYNNRVFLDRDGDTFLLLLNYLRNGTIQKFKNDIEKQNFIEELDYWQIPYVTSPQSKKSPFAFDVNWCAETLHIENNGAIVRKNNTQHGILFCTPTMNEENFFIEFKVTIQKPCKGKSQLFIGLVDKSRYKYDDLLSTFWKDAPSSFYWDVWNMKLIKIDENGNQIGSLVGYGCKCEKKENTFGIKYNTKERTIEYYKNNINYGVAFRNVEDNLTPSLDIWFDEGAVEILNVTEPQKGLFL